MTQPLLGQYSDLLAHLLDIAEQQRVYLVARIQRVESRGVTVVNGKTEGVAAVLAQGIGMHVFDRDDHTAFAATDHLSNASAERALRSAIAGVKAAAAAQLERNAAIWDAEPTTAVDVPPAPYPIDALQIGRAHV